MEGEKKMVSSIITSAVVSGLLAASTFEMASSLL
jgi:hypothetical protein